VILEQKPRGASAADFERVPGQPAAGVLTGDGGKFRLLSVKPVTKVLPLANSSFTNVFVPNVAGRYTVFAIYVPANGQTDFLGNSSKTRRFTAR
jgi:hypothetical protein